LEDDRYAGPELLGRLGSARSPVELEGAAQNRRETGEGKEEARLSASVGARQGHPFAAPDPEREASHDRRAVEPGRRYPEVPGAQHLGFRGPAAGPAPPRGERRLRDLPDRPAGLLGRGPHRLELGDGAAPPTREARHLEPHASEGRLDLGGTSLELVALVEAEPHPERGRLG